MRYGRNRGGRNKMGRRRYNTLPHGRMANNFYTDRSFMVPSYNHIVSTSQSKIKDSSKQPQPVKSSLEKNEIKTRITSKINDMQQKIQKQIKSRRKFVSKNISNDICQEADENTLLKLKPKFIEYLINRSEKSLFQKYQFKKKLEKIQFNLKSGQEDILVNNNGFLSSSQFPKSLLESNFGEWSEWKDIVKQIGKNKHNFKLNKKGEKLNNLFEEYRNLTQAESKNKGVICEECGAKNPVQSLHCHYCGNKL